MPHFNWQRFGGYDCSSKGDPRFSAFNAKLGDGRSIEEHYQCDVKGYDPGGRNWRLGKGKPPLTKQTPEELWTKYLHLWISWAKGNMPLMQELGQKAAQHGNILSDRFASTPINQARALAAILSHLKETGELK